MIPKFTQSDIDSQEILKMVVTVGAGDLAVESMQEARGSILCGDHSFL